MEQITLIIADDHNILRQGLIDALRPYNDIVVVDEAENGQELINKYEKRKPDVVLTDIEMPLISGLEAAEEIIRKDANAKILFLSMYFNEDNIYKVDLIGGKGLLSKEIFKDELVCAIRKVFQGGTYYFGINETDLEKVKLRSNEINNKRKNSGTVLSPREHEIMLELAKAISSEEIAQNLKMGKRTVDTYRSSIMNKLGINTLPKLIKFAIDYEVRLKSKK